ncbi:MAG: helix-turn-helix domain-containing protein [Gaiellaceae bacterium]
MFEIGNSLREARERKAVDFADAERATKIRGKYLRALEDEQFSILPSQTYVKGFLRSYAEYLGLDGQLYVDEYNSRYVVGEEDAPFRARRTSTGGRARQQRGAERRVMLLALIGIAAAAALVIAAWKFGGSSSKTAIPNIGTTQTHRGPVRRPSTPRGSVRVVVTALRGSSLVEVHAGSPTGRLLFGGTLERGKSQHFVSRKLWINAGSAENLRLTLNGRRVAIPSSGGGPSVVTVTPRGVTRAA